MRSNASASRSRSPVSLVTSHISGPKPTEHVNKRLKTLIENLKKKKPAPNPKALGSKSDLTSPRSLLFRKTEQSFTKFVSTLKTSQMPTSQSGSPPTIEELLQENAKLAAEKQKLETMLRKTRVERLFWKEKVMDLEHRIDKRLKHQIEEKESRSQSRELNDNVSKSQSVLFVRTFTSSKDGQKVVNTDISFS